MERHLISVVIPTFRRSHLVRRAVESVLRQTYTLLEVLVVIDGVDDGTRGVIEALDDPRVRVLESGQNIGPAKVRNLGVRNARGRYVALLDDDDEWTEQKLERQMALVQQQELDGQDFIVSCRVIVKIGDRSHVWPKRLFQTGDDLSEYLLDRAWPFARPGVVCSGTLLFPRSLAIRVPFVHDEMHEDWSWLLLCVARDAVKLAMCEEAMFILNMDPNAESRSKALNWRASITWGRQYRDLISGPAFAALLATTAAWRAKRKGGLRGLLEITRVMRREGQPTASHWFMLASVILIPADLVDRIRRWTFSNG